MFTDNKKLVNTEREKEFLWIFYEHKYERIDEGPLKYVTIEGNVAKIKDGTEEFDVPLLSCDINDDEYWTQYVLHIQQEWVLEKREGLQFLLWLRFRHMTEWLDIREKHGVKDIFKNYNFYTKYYDDKDDMVCCISFDSATNCTTTYSILFYISPEYELEYDKRNPLNCEYEEDFEKLHLFSHIDFEILFDALFFNEIENKELEEFVDKRFMPLLKSFRYSEPVISDSPVINDMFEHDFLDSDMVGQCDEFSLYNLEKFGGCYTLEYGDPSEAVCINVFDSGLIDDDYQKKDYGFYDSTITIQDERIDESTIISELKHICKRKGIKLI